MPARRGRPPSFDRAEVLDKLLFLFWEKGYEATSQSDMIDRAGISSSSLYNTFGNKPDVFDACLTRYNEMSHGLLAPLRDGSGGLDDVGAFLEGVVAHIESREAPPGCLMVRTMTELGGRSNGSSTDERTCTYRDQITEALRVALGRAAAKGEIDPDEVESKAFLVLSVYLGALAVAVSSPEAGAAMLASGREMVAGWNA